MPSTLMGPRMTTLLFTSMTGIISGRLQIYCGDADGIGFPALVQWASSSYRGPLLEEIFTTTRRWDTGTDPAKPSHYRLSETLICDSVTGRTLRSPEFFMHPVRRWPSSPATLLQCQTSRYMSTTGLLVMVSREPDRMQRGKIETYDW